MIIRPVDVRQTINFSTGTSAGSMIFSLNRIIGGRILKPLVAVGSRFPSIYSSSRIDSLIVIIMK